MKKYTLYIIAIVAIGLFASCKSEQKITYYNNIYTEKPTTIYIAPVQDYAERKPEKYPKDQEFNAELNYAKNFFYQTLSTPIINQGYYVIGPIAAKEIAATESRDLKKLHKTDLTNYHKYFGIDAILFTTIHKWEEKNGEWTVYVEYILRSTKTYNELLHTWVKATKKLALNLKKDPVPMRSDNVFAKKMELSNGTTQRCILVEQLNDFILRDIPISSLQRQYEQDQFLRSNSEYLNFLYNENGEIECSPISMEAFENECFLN